MEENKKSLKMPIIATIAIIVILLIIGGVFYINNRQNPKNIFMGAINNGLNSLAEEREDIKTINSNISLGVKIENSQDQDIAQVAEYLNKAKITSNVQMDVEQEKEIMKLGLEYDNEKVLEGQLYYKNKEDNAYIFVNELFDKYFAVTLDENAKEQITSLFDTSKQILLGENGDDKKVAEILKKVIEARLKDEYISQEDAEIEVNGEKVKTKKSVLKFSQNQLIDELLAMVSELKNNEEFINCFAEEDKEIVKKAFEEMESKINNLKSSNTKNEDSSLQVNVYTKGLNSDFVKLEIVVTDTDFSGVLNITKTDKNTYNLLVTQTVKGETEELFNCNLTITEVDNNTSEYVFKTNIAELGDITVTLQLSCVYNEVIENVDTSNSVDIEEVSEEDQEKILENLQKMKIYSLIKEIIGVDPFLMLSAMQ